LPGHRQEPLLGDAGFMAAGGAPATASAGIQRRAPDGHGGLWVACYEQFAVTGKPVHDVTRLGLMCGPVNGMTQLMQTQQGEVQPTDAGPPARGGSHRFVARSGHCYRIFAVAATTIEDLDLTVRSSRGSRLTADDTDDRWPVVDRQRPFCSFQDDTFSVDVSADDGHGGYALQVWQLPRTR